jgi:solute carrier family 13 (sodium-dependent dicarboxylate transporter), member 2/3/5
MSSFEKPMENLAPVYRAVWSWFWIAAGPLLGLLSWYFFDRFNPDAPIAAKSTLFVGVWMACWWMTEAVILEATAFLPIVLLPLLGISKIQEATAAYADPSVFLYLGGFSIAIAFEKTGLHRRGAIYGLSLFGTSPSAIVAGFMMSTMLLSFWISNTATALLMLPLVRSVLVIAGEGDESPNKVQTRNFGIALLLGVAYSASLGGMGTLVGTPTNVFFRSFMEKQGTVIGFLEWMYEVIPCVLLITAICWFWLCKVLFVSKPIPTLNSDWIRNERASLTKLSSAESWVLGVFVVTGLSWTFRDVISNSSAIRDFYPGVSNIHDSMIAMTAMVFLLTIPVRTNFGGQPILNWRDMDKLPWGVILLLGGGLSLAGAVQTSGLGGIIGESARHLKGIPIGLSLLLIIAMVVFLSELASNIATATTVIPILAEIARGLDVDVSALTVPAVLAASCGLMLPVATPPNAIVFGEKRMTSRDMMRAGIGLDIVCILVIWLLWLPR